MEKHILKWDRNQSLLYHINKGIIKVIRRCYKPKYKFLPFPIEQFLETSRT